VYNENLGLEGFAGNNTVTLAVAAFNYPPLPALPVASRGLVDLRVVFAAGPAPACGSSSGARSAALSGGRGSSELI
ncbi:MAG: hypothetical protein ACO3AC_08160, partial [Hylemonella sp.]